ncbi:MAG TPA: hypothetical protein VIR15_07680 [Intrasporangium sp.]|jgi:hypothetical protein|uniref:hypothetical protein n=1 Tax=Intrasporangium sp. TaxID=1925024 RepID=UPI002F94C58A
MQVAIEEIRGRIKALDSQMEFERETQANVEQALAASRKRLADLDELRQAYLAVLNVTGETAPEYRWKPGGAVKPPTRSPR